MQKLGYAIAVAAALTAGTAAAAQKDPNNVGCGLGTIAWEGQSGQGPQILAATTNGTFGTQTFGITSGTSGCARGGRVYRPDELAAFIGPNMDRFVQEMAAGRGETLASAADLIGIDDADRDAFYAAAQRNFGRIVPSETATAADVAVSLNAVMSEDPQLKRYVLS
ncbi:MAG: DUF3015 domain-containing protein [Rhodospirillales bacterium]|jgi:hypothetical protein|nr:DUF3015 domain-containing protein [Rhodospirillales bacterium]